MVARRSSSGRPRFRRKATIGASLLALVGVLFWNVTPFPAIVALSTLSDPAKLDTLGERGANSRLNKIVYWMDDARQHGVSAETAVGWAQTFNGTGEPRASLVKASLLRNLQIADQLGLFAQDNPDRLKRGSAGVITRGPYTGETVEIDHIVPYSVAPEVGNELANLEMLPKPLNRQKSDHIGERQVAHAEILFKAGLLKPGSLEAVRKRSKPQSASPQQAR